MGEESTPPLSLPPAGNDKPPQRGAIASWFRGALLDNIGLKFLSMVLAATLFLLVNTDKDREISLDHKTDPFVAETEIVPPNGVDLESSPHVAVQIHIDEKLVVRNLPGVSVSVRGDGIDPARWALTPAQVDVTLTGAQLAVETALTAMRPVIKLAAGDQKSREAVVVIDGLPPGIGVKISPERVMVAPVKPPPPTP